MPFCPGTPSQRGFCRVVGQTDATVIEKARERRPSFQHVVHRFGDFGVTREPAASARIHCSSAPSEGTIERLLRRRMNAKQQMRWSPRGARLMLKVRTAVLNDTLDRDHRMASRSEDIRTSATSNCVAHIFDPGLLLPFAYIRSQVLPSNAELIRAFSSVTRWNSGLSFGR